MGSYLASDAIVAADAIIVSPPRGGGFKVPKRLPFAKEAKRFEVRNVDSIGLFHEFVNKTDKLVKFAGLGRGASLNLV